MIIAVSCAILITGTLSKGEVYTKDIPVNQNRLRRDVMVLTSIQPPRYYKNIDSLNRIADYIYKEFKKLSCHTTIQPFTINGDEYKNIICSFGINKEERIVVGAHYDVFGPFPGADDNASGVAGLLELARLLNEQKPDMTRRIDLVAYSLEEPPFFRTSYMGSSIHARSLSKSSSKVTLMICLESIGYFSDKPNSQHFPLPFLRWFYPDRGNFIVVVGKWGQSKPVKKVRALMSQVSAIYVDSIVAPSFLPGIDLSDHLNYWKYGYDAVMITDSAFYRNPHYHQLSDTIETLNFNAMAEVIRGVYWTVINY